MAIYGRMMRDADRESRRRARMTPAERAEHDRRVSESSRRNAIEGLRSDLKRYEGAGHTAAAQAIREQLAVMDEHTDGT